MNTNQRHTKSKVATTTSVSWISDFAQLVKMRLNLTVVFSAVMAYLIVAGDQSNMLAITILSIGGFCVTSAANALNEVLERDYDKLMKRTENRPLATGRMSVSSAVLIAGMMSVIGVTLLAFFNPWAALLGMISLITYAFIYTPMKRTTPLAVVVGAIPGALPVLIGCVAFQGEITALAILLFMIQFIWQFPHFWSIAWLGDEDYKNAGFNLLPSESGVKDESVGLLSLMLTLAFIPTYLTLWYLGDISLLTMVLCQTISTVFGFFSWNLYKKCDRKAALSLMFSSFAYIPAVFIIIYLIG